MKKRRKNTSSSSSKPAKVGIHTLGRKDGKINRTIPSIQNSNSNSNRQGRAYTKDTKGGGVAFTGEDDIAGQLLRAVSSSQGAKGNSGQFFRLHFMLFIIPAITLIPSTTVTTLSHTTLKCTTLSPTVFAILFSLLPVVVWGLHNNVSDFLKTSHHCLDLHCGEQYLCNTMR